MPRAAPSTAKRQQGAANHRDTRHENGLVGPGKRVQRQKSNGHLNGHAKSSEPSTPPLPATPPPATNGNGHARAAANVTETKLPVNGLRRSSIGVYSEETSSSESYNNMPAIAVHNENHRRIDVNSAKNPAVHRDVGPLSLVLTVLRSCPLYDTIAILIVLLQIPPTFLSIIHILFATLTFVPTSTSTTTGISFSDIFEGTLGTPSVATIVFVDIFVLLVWLFLWGPLQDVVLDLAQTVIALTLGGGTSGREAGMNNVLVCFSIIGFSHLVRNGNVKQSGIRAFISSSTNGLLGSPDSDDPLEPISQSLHKKGARGWIRSILAIHILTQGVVRYIRDWYVRRERRDTSTSLHDPEAGKVQTDANSDTPTPTPENEPSNLATTSINTKKKKKQSAQVRLRQPLWAALASTKIVMVKEYETSHTAAESAGTNATDINNLGNAPFNTEADKIWITYVGHDEVFFATSYFPTHAPQGDCEEKKGMEASEIDESKPFFVRVNKTFWRPTKIYTTTDPDQPAGQDMRWSGEIFGLAPMSSYQCDFVSTVDGTIIFSTNVRTVQPQLDVSATGLSPGPVISGRPGSPTTTLKTSIASSEVKLAEERNRQKRERKDQRAKLSNIRKEIEKLAGGIASSGGNDDRQRQKVQQHHLHTKQAEEAIALLESQIEDLSSLPSNDDLDEMKAAKLQYQSQKDIHKKARKEYTAIKEQARDEVQTLKNDVVNLESKHERVQIRNAKLTGDLERIKDANARGLDEAQRKITEQQAKEVERQNMEGLYKGRLVGITTELMENRMQFERLGALVAQLQAMEQSEMYTQSPNASVPNLSYADIPEASTASNYPWNPAPNSGLYAPSYPMMASGSNQGMRTRGRSSSMLSNVSGFTQSSGEGDSHQLQLSSHNSFSKFVLPNMYLRERQGSSESASVSGSGSRSGNGSVGDPKSPIARNGSVRKWGSGSIAGDKGNADEKL
ncbi:Acriflavine resistance B [Hyphodiscus hymeniophilus]|uniref:Acriflavine resistance B n=1 Tax=Hyphodiscus hymeniophilus TaxID=353542 RepID=A0A9P6VFB6_9HELO|nr:Acriflavine resistance B [Hyphodiscus hymeniophilus]